MDFQFWSIVMLIIIIIKILIINVNFKISKHSQIINLRIICIYKKDLVKILIKKYTLNRKLGKILSINMKVY